MRIRFEIPYFSNREVYSSYDAAKQVATELHQAARRCDIATLKWLLDIVCQSVSLTVRGSRPAALRSGITKPQQVYSWPNEAVRTL